ncbi:MFS transporter, FSR family, fosmidomycin resistance protein [Paracoccus isoporae]|uniref:MFS transporter, FSR family, fosmidomycin resistance protein n=1 Tax=Paracoccus isoporae TaxID=591205 RepID=A0A1G6TMD7_9RHOB|nr:MFS transporter [Paracoccus isoporae]SDD30352.1 MFS transporter, FSR family, fosmidomycin resistance protein [Paracoccus isoporae]
MAHPATNSAAAPERTTWLILAGVSLCHMLNDIMQSLLAAIYPLLKAEFALDFWQIGLLTLAFQGTASMLQPAVGLVTDRHPLPMSLPLGMGCSLLGLLALAQAPSYPLLVAGAMLIGIGSAVFHPEASRVARMASGGRFGTAQSFFQVGGNAGTAIGPLLAAFIVVPNGRGAILWFTALALLGVLILSRVGVWYAAWLRDTTRARKPAAMHALSRRKVKIATAILALLTFSKNIYTASFTSYYTFYLIEKFELTTQQSQVMLFLFLAAMAVGVILGGPLGDRFRPLTVIWISILGALPFTLMLPHVGLMATGVLTVVIGVVIASAFPAIVVFAQELVPGRVGLIAGIFFGFAFGSGAIAAAALGVVADLRGVGFVFALCAWTPAIGVLTVFLPRRAAMAVSPAPQSPAARPGDTPQL